MHPSHLPTFQEIVEIHNAGDLVFIKSILDANGIDYYVQGEHAAHYLFNSVPMRLMVHRDQAAAVQQLIADVNLSYAYDGLERG